ncbi:MAG TPA: SpoIIE family protein phosphatase, partial [Gemmatimonadales bacterium]|nr:SpoIIE family protein phosphatase [Gemmatimonadales bacterium]
PAAHEDFELGVVNVAHPLETVSGDGWAFVEGDWGAALMVADGLGHGPLAAAAAREANRVFLDEPSAAPTEIMGDLHRALHPTRGATVAIARLDRARREIRFCGVGNIAGAVVSGPESRSMVSMNGTVGHEMYGMQEFVYPWPRRGFVILHSDGLQSRWRLDRYPAVEAHHPAIVAALLYRDFVRGRDDATVAAVREPAA